MTGLVLGAVIGVIWLVLEWQTGARLKRIENEMRRLNEFLRAPVRAQSKNKDDQATGA